MLQGTDRGGTQAVERDWADTCGERSKIDRDKYIKALPDLVDRAVNEAMTIAVTRVPESEDVEKMFTYAYDGKPVDF